MTARDPAMAVLTTRVRGIDVHGVDIDPETRCAHWRSHLDVIAIRFKCCLEWYSCSDCHRELAGHKTILWQTDEFASEAVVCGACGHKLRIDEYLECGSTCTACRAPFNPGCAKHYGLYFDLAHE